MQEIPKQAFQFVTDGTPVYHMRYGSGHINDTYFVLDITGRAYILQRINQNVFKKPDELMENVRAVTLFVGKQVAESRKALGLVPTKAGDDWLVDDSGDYWRMYYYISDSLCLQQAEHPSDFRESGVAFGNFQRQLADFPAETLNETIVKFHDTPNRYMNFHKVLKADPCGRAALAAKEIEFALAREGYAATLMNLLEKGDLPLRVTHNDTKLNNVLFDRDSRKAVCVVDLDTVMPGLSVNDFGDSIRFGASTGAEDEMDLSKVNFSLPLFEAYTDGFLESCGKSLTQCEIQHLRDGAKMMTLECGLRFLTDFIDGDNYFGAKREGHNLDRCRTQFKLVAEMEKYWDDMQNIIMKEV
ncbi:MAG: aminoglycoside phosphotransferase family protein [Defluviitaleaceae bacterium]|nr:aminoglycoside phosphotransferase family protein [Defluviitaleaceae bacterium]